MNLPPEFLFEVSSQVLCYNQICDYFGLSDEQRKSPSAGKWVIEWIKDMQQVMAMYKTKAIFPKTDENIPENTPMNPLIKGDVSS